MLSHKNQMKNVELYCSLQFMHYQPAYILQSLQDMILHIGTAVSAASVVLSEKFVFFSKFYIPRF